MTTLHALPAFVDGRHLVETFGLLGLLVIIFAETGLLLGFFLPGDSLLFAAGLAATGKLSHNLHPNIVVVCVLASSVAILGAQTGFLIGRAAGPALFQREDSRLFKQSYVTKAEELVERYGAGRAIVLARFVPIVRTFLNPLVGAGQLPARTFTTWNVVGGILWGTGVTLIGYFLGGFRFIEKNLDILSLLVVAVSVLPIILELRRGSRGTSEN
ncbi:MAG: hypothetical protein NVSMB55_11040 [Mycobacteriales bacterium]